MKKITLLLASLFLVACGHNWSEGDEKDFMDDCKDGDNSTDECECVWNAKTDAFPSADDEKDFIKRGEDDKFEDSDYDLMRSTAKNLIDCIKDDKDLEDMAGMFMRGIITETK